jgi:hypothetical protein
MLTILNQAERYRKIFVNEYVNTFSYSKYERTNKRNNYGTVRLSMTTPSITTLSLTALSIMTFSLTTCKNTTLSITTFSIEYFMLSATFSHYSC